MTKLIIHKLDKETPGEKTVICKKELRMFTNGEMFTREWKNVNCTGLPHSIPVRSELPNSIYVDASDLQRVLDNFLQGFTYAIAEGMKANPVENLVRQGVSQPVLRTDIEEKYNELIMAVATKFTNETRHETALRYIKEAENFNDNSCAKNESEQSA